MALSDRWPAWADVLAWLRSLERPTPPTPHGAPPYVPGWDAPPILKSCRYCGASVAEADFAVHVVEHQARGDRMPTI